MLSSALQTVLPFFSSAAIVIIILLIAEKYGTKVGGIIGTIPTTVIIAYVFISLNQGLLFASKSVAVVPAEMGVNLLFICVFAVLAYHSTFVALFGSFSIWVVLSAILFFIDMHYIYPSLIIFIVSMALTFVFLEKKLRIRSQGKRVVHYTPLKIFLRGIMTGVIITISVLLSNFGEVLSGIFTVFPVIFSSTMIITLKEHGPDFSAGIAKSMIFGSPSIASYAVAIHFLYPIYDIFWGSVFAFIISVIITLILLKFREKIS